METRAEKISYIIGRQIGSDFLAQGIEVCADTFSNAVKSALNGEESSLSQEETQAVMGEFQQEMQAKAQEQASKAGEANLERGKAYLESNKAQEGVQVTASGLQYKVVTSGDGATPEATSTVDVHYEGTLIDGTVFDSSYKRGQSISFPVNGVIPGWTEALQLMKEGDIWELVIPSDLAYGANGAGGQIGPNETLLFKVELIKVS